MTGRILIVDDEPDNLQIYSGFLRRAHQVEVAEAGDAALQVMEAQEVDVLITDFRMPGMDGLELARRVRHQHPYCETILVSAHADLESALEAIRLGVVEYLRKPVRRIELERAVDRALEKRRTLGSLRRYQERDQTSGLGRILGNSPPIERLRTEIVRVQNTDATILVRGETGTGKELVAQALHEGSHRSEAPFVAVNCGALAPDILESELFGHEKGAFTGASDRTRGLFESAQGGTVFLDEIGECPPALQVNLLRVLQERRIVRVGGRKPIPVDVRIIAATHRDLPAMVRAGEFREDLYFRLNVYPLWTPALRTIPGDVPVLAEHFLRRSCREFRRELKPLGDEALARLVARPWPGNIRELQNLVARLALLSQGDEVTPEDLEAASDMDVPLLADASSASGAGACEVTSEFAEALLRETPPPPLEEVQRMYVLAALNRCKDNRSDTANLLGIHRATLRRKLVKWGLADGDDDEAPDP